MFWISSKYLPEAPLCTMSLWKFDVSPGARRMTSGIMTKLCSSSILVLAADAEMASTRSSSELPRRWHRPFSGATCGCGSIKLLWLPLRLLCLTVVLLVT